jgi:putative zinc finger protein
MNWHAPAELLSAYVRGDLDHARVLSIEAHTLRCAECRERLSDLAAPLADRTWPAIADTIDTPRVPWIERWLERLGVTSPTARLIGTTPSMRMSWFMSTLAALGFGVALSHVASGASRSLPFLVIAPLMPVLAIGAVYGSPLSNANEIERATPFAPWRLLLLRSLAVLTVCVVSSAALSLAIPGPATRAWLWLAPALALSAVVLALSTWLSLSRAATISGVLWIATIVGCSAVRSPRSDAVIDRFVMFRPAGQLATLALTLVCALIFASRARRVDPYLGRLA